MYHMKLDGIGLLILSSLTIIDDCCGGVSVINTLAYDSLLMYAFDKFRNNCEIKRSVYMKRNKESSLNSRCFRESYATSDFLWTLVSWYINWKKKNLVCADNVKAFWYIQVTVLKLKVFHKQFIKWLTIMNFFLGLFAIRGNSWKSWS